MANEKRTIEIPNNAELKFTYRLDKEQTKEQAKTAKVRVDISKLSVDDLMEWAFSNMVISYQSKLRSKNPPAVAKVPALDDNGQPLLNEDKTPKMVDADYYEWAVPPRGTRTTVDPEKAAELANKLVEKMGDDEKKKLIYTTLVSMGKSSAEATAISGYTPPAAPLQENVPTK